MRGHITTMASREWARRKGLSGKLPVYNTFENRPAYGAVSATETINARNQQTIARLLPALAMRRAGFRPMGEKSNA